MASDELEKFIKDRRNSEKTNISATVSSDLFGELDEKFRNAYVGFGMLTPSQKLDFMLKRLNTVYFGEMNKNTGLGKTDAKLDRELSEANIETNIETNIEMPSVVQNHNGDKYDLSNY